MYIKEIVMQYYGFNISAFIVSDGQEKPNHLLGIPVLYLSEIINRNCGVIIAMLPKYQKEVIPNLKSRGFDYFILY